LDGLLLPMGCLGKIIMVCKNIVGLSGYKGKEQSTYGHESGYTVSALYGPFDDYDSAQKWADSQPESYGVEYRAIGTKLPN
jgi:hypothetical protein